MAVKSINMGGAVGAGAGVVWAMAWALYVLQVLRLWCLVFLFCVVHFFTLFR